MPAFDGLDVSNKEWAALRRAALVSTAEVLLCPPTVLARRLRLSQDETDAIFQTIVLARCPLSTTVTAELEAHPTLGVSTGDAGLDQLLGGSGVRYGSVTEIVGHAAAGKSQLCLQLALAVQTGPDSGSALILSSETSESAFPSQRLEQLADVHAQRLGCTVTSMLDHIVLNTAASFELLEHVVRYGIPARIEQMNETGAPPVRLLIIDSIAAPMRAEYGDGEAFQKRARDLAVLVSALKSLAHRHRLAVVVVNQVTDVMTLDAAEDQLAGSAILYEQLGTTTPLTTEYTDRSSAPEPLAHVQTALFDGRSPALPKRAALGLSWSQHVDTRLMLSASVPRSPDDATMESVERTRTATVIFSPYAAPASIDYVVRAKGIVTVSQRYNVGVRNGLVAGHSRPTAAWWRVDEAPVAQPPPLSDDPTPDELAWLDEIEASVDTNGKGPSITSGAPLSPAPPEIE